MNQDTLAGDAATITGTAKEAVGGATGDRTMEAEGAVDRIAGRGRALFGEARDAAEPYVEKARSFARERPAATALAAGVIGLALIGSLRGSRKA